MKVLVLTLLTLAVAVALAIPVELDSDDESQITLVDVDSEQPIDESAPDAVRSKRFILKKIALAKAGLLGVGALGLAGAVAAKSSLGLSGGLSGLSGLSGGGGGGAQYGSSYGYNSVQPPTYYTSPPVVQPQPQPQPIYTVQQQQPVYGVPQQQPLGPFSAALQWKSGLVNGFTNSLSSGFGGVASIIGMRPPAPGPVYTSYNPNVAPAPAPPAVSSQVSASPGYVLSDVPVSVSSPGYSYGPSVQAPPPPPPPPAPVAAVGPVPNKPVYVVCDNNN